MTTTTPNMQALPTIKQGDTLELICRYQDAKGIAKSLAHVAVSSNLCDAQHRIVAAMRYEQLVDMGTYSLRCEIPVDCKLGQLVLDIKYVTAAVVQHTDTLVIMVQQAVTR